MLRLIVSLGLCVRIDIDSEISSDCRIIVLLMCAFHVCRGVARIFGLGGRPCRVEPDKHRPFNQCLTFYGPFKEKG